MLSNAMIGGLLVALYVTLVCLQLNPRIALSSLPGLAGTLIASYGLHSGAAFYVLVVLRQLVSTEVLSPGWISFRFLVWLSAVASLVGSLLVWANLSGFRAVLDASVVRRMTGGALALTACAGVCALLVIVHRWSGRRSSRAGAAVLGAAVMLSVAVPLTLRGPGLGRPPAARPRPAGNVVPAAEAAPRVTLLLFEGASLDIIVPAAAAGRLPHFERLLDEGALMHLATLRPTQPSPVWTAAATGKLPTKNGIRSVATYRPFASPDRLDVLPDYCFAHALVRLGLLDQQLHTSRDLTALPLWQILGRQGVSVGVVNWPVTYPAARVPGYLVSDEVGQGAQTPVELAAGDAIWPPEAAGLAVSAAAVARPRPEEAIPDVPGADIGDGLVSPCNADRRLDLLAIALERQMPSRFRAIRYECLDAVGHYFLRYAMPASFGDVSEDELHRFGNVLPTQYGVADGIVGRELAALGPGDLLLVLSGFGMEPIDPGKRVLERAFGNPRLNGTHERAPDGFLLAFGSAVQAGHFPRASIVDVAPTILYFLGLPVGHDMDGYARTDIFRPSPAEARPITYIPTYER
jgi:hypothetical protein